MPGLHTLFTSVDMTSLLWETYLSGTLYDNRYKIEVFSETARSFMAISHYPGYPFLIWKEGDIQIVLEGMVYNKSKDELRTELLEIARSFIKNGEYENKVRKFVEVADGDYIIEMWQISTGRLLIFNDYFGRLPLYYSCQNGLCAVSREIKVILDFMPKISLNRAGLVDFLTFEFTRGNKTIFSNILRLNPSQMLLVNWGVNGVDIAVRNTCNFNFILHDPFSSKEESIDVMRDIFMESIKIASIL